MAWRHTKTSTIHVWSHFKSRKVKATLIGEQWYSHPQLREYCHTVAYSSMHSLSNVLKSYPNLDTTRTISLITELLAKTSRDAHSPHQQRCREDVEMTLRQTWSSKTWTAICVQRFDDSLNSAIHITYRSWLRSSSMHEPRDPPLEVVTFRFCLALELSNTG